MSGRGRQVQGLALFYYRKKAVKNLIKIVVDGNTPKNI